MSENPVCPGAKPLVPSVVAHVIRDGDEWDRLRGEWNDLFAVSPTASAPLQFDWLRQWWRVYGPIYGDGGKGLRIVTVRRGTRLIGVLPLYESVQGHPLFGSRRLGFLSTGEAQFEETCPEYLDLLHAPGEERACLEAARSVLLGEGTRWDELDLPDLSERSPLLAWRAAFPNGQARETDAGVCPVADLAGGFEAYLSRLSANTRQQARRHLRAVEKAGATFAVAADSEAAGPFLDDLVRLHQERWVAAGKPGCFAAPRFTAFHRALAAEWVPAGKAVLARVSLGDQALAAIYGFVVGPKFSFYQSGARLDGDGPLQSPGVTAHLLLMRHLADRGVAEYDFLRGSLGYKQRLTTQECRLKRLRILRPTLRTGLRLLSCALRRASRRLRRVVAPLLTPSEGLSA